MRYYCGKSKRRWAIEDHNILNGIDYLEVMDSPDMDFEERQRMLQVYFLNNNNLDSLTVGNIRIEGGERITNINVINLEVISAANLLQVKVDQRGDFSTYTLRLVKGGYSQDPPDNFDPVLSAIDFSFKIERPSDFDCKVEETYPAGTRPAPPINYLAKDYASFRRLMLDRLAVTVPDWRERNPADLEIALVEALAYAADHLSYYQDAVATETYLGTARKRISLRRHARLLDYHMHEGCNARVWVHLHVEEGSAADGHTLRAESTHLLTGLDEGQYARLQAAPQNGPNPQDVDEQISMSAMQSSPANGGGMQPAESHGTSHLPEGEGNEPGSTGVES